MGDSWEYANEGVDVFLATFSGLQVPWCLSALAGPPLLLSPWGLLLSSTDESKAFQGGRGAGKEILVVWRIPRTYMDG